MPLRKARKSVKSKSTLKFKIDLTNPIDDGIIDIKKFEAFLKDKIKVQFSDWLYINVECWLIYGFVVKVEGKTNNLGNRIMVASDKKVITVTSNIELSKRYLKYLSKKFLKKSELRDWLRVVATDKDSYTFRYFDINNDDNDDDDDE